MTQMQKMGARAKAAARVLNTAGTAQKNAALRLIEMALEEHAAELAAVNEGDVAAALADGLSQSMADRLRLGAERVAAVADAVGDVARAEDPVGRVLGGDTRPNGLRVVKTSVPLGVVGVIFEARPNVTVDAAALCLKSGNACILRGGKEAIGTNKALVALMRAALAKAKLPEDCIQLVEDTSRKSARELMELTGYLDVLVPRGGAGLIKTVVERAKVPVIETGTGNCHVYVDETADMKMALAILMNGKTQRPSVCNAVETLLVHAGAAAEFLPLAAQELTAAGVELRCCARSQPLMPGAALATQEDYETEFNDLILAVRVVDSLDEAITHIDTFGTRHSECIVTSSYENAQRFLREVDAAAVYANASTRFTDGAEFGYGAELGISTQKLHARGPMGLREMTTCKYIVTGDGQIRE